MGQMKRKATQFKGTSPSKGEVPASCQVCGGDFRYGLAVDGKTQMGPWAWLCADCFGRHGLGLGVGKGQAYALDKSTGRWEKRHAS